MHIPVHNINAVLLITHKGLGQPNSKIHHNKTEHIEQLQGTFVKISE